MPEEMCRPRGEPLWQSRAGDCHFIWTKLGCVPLAAIHWFATTSLSLFYSRKAGVTQL